MKTYVKPALSRVFFGWAMIASLTPATALSANAKAEKEVAIQMEPLTLERALDPSSLHYRRTHARFYIGMVGVSKRPYWPLFSPRQSS